MGADILPQIPRRIPILILDSILFLFTNSSSSLRRLSYSFTLLLYLISIYTLFKFNPLTFFNSNSISKTTTTKKSTTSTTTSSTDSIYKPLPPTTKQLDNFNKLTKLIELTHSSYEANSFKEISLESESTTVVGTTAIILNWKRLKGVQMVVSQISRYPFIREIIIWNNNQNLDLTPEDFTIYNFPTSTLKPAKLRIYNSPSNMHDAGKHLACSLATYEHCYFNDDDWLNIYLDSLYTKYLECCAGSGGSKRGIGGKIASNTLPIIHLEHKRWRFENPEIEMKTGFTWIGCGSFAPKHFSVRFMKQQSSAPVPLDREQSLVADMFFSLWSNSYPEQMPNNLVPIDLEGIEVGWSQQSNVDQWAVVYSNILDATRKLYSILLAKEPFLCPIPFPTSPSIGSRSTESYLRAPCANDKCLFMTSLTPFKTASSLNLQKALNKNSNKRNGNRKKNGRSWSLFGGSNAKSDLIETTNTETGNGFNPYAIEHIKEYESIWNLGELGSDSEWPSDDWWMNKGSWHLAVDGKGVETCWESWRAPEANDHFGLSLVRPKAVSRITIIGSIDLSKMLGFEKQTGEAGWEIQTIGEDSNRGWQTRRLKTSPKIEKLSSSRISVTIDLIPTPFISRSTNKDRDTKHKDLSVQDKEEEEEGIKIRKIKFISRGGRKINKLEICQFDLDGWKL